MVQRDPPRRPGMIPYGVLMGLTILPGLLLSIGLPNIPGMFIVRVQIDPHAGKDLAHGIDELRFGVWSFCQNQFDLSLGKCPPYALCKRGYNDATVMKYVCTPKQNGYAVDLQPVNETNQKVTIPKSKSRGLALHPAATIFTLLAITFRLRTWIFSGIAFALTLSAFALDLHFYQFVNAQMRKLGAAGVVHKTTSGPGVWLTLTITILVFIEFAQCTVEELLAYRRQRGQNDFTPSAGAAEVRQRNIDSGATRRDSSPAVDLYSCENCNRVFDNALELVEHHSSAHLPIPRRPQFASESSSRTANSFASIGGTARTASTLGVQQVSSSTPKIEEEQLAVDTADPPEQFGVQMIPMNNLGSQQTQVQPATSSQRRTRHTEATGRGSGRRTGTESGAQMIPMDVLGSQQVQPERGENNQPGTNRATTAERQRGTTEFGVQKACTFCMRTNDLGKLPCCDSIYCFECMRSALSMELKCPTCRNPSSIAEFVRERSSGRKRQR